MHTSHGNDWRETENLGEVLVVSVSLPGGDTVLYHCESLCTEDTGPLCRVHSHLHGYLQLLYQIKRSLIRGKHLYH